jgi:hypothetical protein
MIKTNGSYTGAIAPKIHGMIDANAYHISLATWPVPLAYVYIDALDKSEPAKLVDRDEAERILSFVDGKKIRYLTTTDIGNFLVELNSHMYNTEKTPDYEDFKKLSQLKEDIKKLLNGRKREDLKNKNELRQLDELEKEEKDRRKMMTDVYRKDIPSLIIATTMDMEFAHIGGYDGKSIYLEDKETGEVFYEDDIKFTKPLDEDDGLMFQAWMQQVSDVEAAAIANPFRLYPLFSYDPRRYRLPNEEKPGGKGCAHWKEPFSRIVGHDDCDGDIKKIWLGFSMNPLLGFRPFDEYCEHLPRFYSECEKNDIPILAHCSTDGVITRDVEHYIDKTGKRIDKNKTRHEMIQDEKLSSCKNKELRSCNYNGYEYVVGDKYDSLDYFYMNYGHPRNWIPVLEYFPKLRLCLSGFGGNSEWLRADWSNSAELPSRLWIRSIIKLTAEYDNVYADLSGLNIYDKKIRNGLLKMLDLIQDEENDEFKHLKT